MSSVQSFGDLVRFLLQTSRSTKVSRFVVASEIMGRRAVLLIAFTLYLLTFVGQALAQNIETLLIMRFFGGVFGSAPLAAGGGIIVDLWDVRDRAVPSTVYLTSVIIGPSIATIAGGL